MNWIEKVRYLKMRQEKKDYDKDKYYIDALFMESKWKPNELEDILEPYPYIPKGYIEFIKEFDNIGLSFAGFYGSKSASSFISLKEYVDEFKEFLKYDYFPFGKDPAGSVFAFNRKQEVVYFDIDDYEFQNPEKIADNFEEFVGECLTGKKIEGFLSETSGYYKLIKHLGWV